jgi:hypothetical protein
MEEWALIPSGNSDWITYVIMVNFLLFVFCKWRYQLQFFSFLRVIDTPLYFTNYEERPIYSQGFILLSVLFSLINISLFICFYLSKNQYALLEFNLFAIIFFGICGTIVLRQIILTLLSYFLELQHFINQYQFRTSTYLFRLNIFVFIGLVLYFYTFNLSPVFLESFTLISGVLYISYHFLVVKQLFSIINQGGLYFILYLCTLKLSPWIILINGLKLSL